MVLKNGEIANIDEIYDNIIGPMWKNQAQSLYNQSLIGFNSKLNVASGVPNLKNVKYDVFNSDTATSSSMMYNSTDKLYNSINPSELLYYVIIEADSYSGSLKSQDGLINLSNTKWLIFDKDYKTNNEGKQKAVIHNILWGTPEITNFVGVTSVKVSSSSDVGKRAYKIVADTGVGQGETRYWTGTFGTTTNNSVSSWSYLRCQNLNGGGARVANWEMPIGTVLNTTGTTSNEIGSDTSSEDKNNPAGCKVSFYVGGTGGQSANYYSTVLLITKGALSIVDTSLTSIKTDYYTDYSVPEFTQADTLVNEGMNINSLIFKTTSLPTIKDCIATWNASIDGDNTLTVSISADGTNYEEVTDATIHRFTNTGTNLYVKFEIDRVDNSAVDKISEYGILYNVTNA